MTKRLCLLLFLLSTTVLCQPGFAAVFVNEDWTSDAPYNSIEFTLINNTGDTITDFAVGNNYPDNAWSPLSGWGGLVLYRSGSNWHIDWSGEHVPWLDTALPSYNYAFLFRGHLGGTVGPYDTQDEFLATDARSAASNSDFVALGAGAAPIKYYGTTNAAVPIPSAIWLLGSAFIGIVGFRRKFKKA